MKIWWLVVSIVLVTCLALFIWLGMEIDSANDKIADGTHEVLIVLGAKVKPGGVPSLSLKNRLEVAADYLHKYPHVTVIVSGGQGHDEDRTEASVMRDYLIDKGIEANRIIEEDASTSTYENLKFSKELLAQDVTNITIVSNDFHLRRASFLAEQLGLEADVLPAKTPASVNLKSRLRERAALLKTFILN